MHDHPSRRRRPGFVAVAVAAVLGLVALGACSDDDVTAGDDSTPEAAVETTTAPSTTSTSTTTEPSGPTTDSRPGTSTTNPGAPDFCAAWANIPAYAGSLPTDTLEELRTTTIQLAAAFGVLVDAAPDAVRPQVELLEEQAVAIRDATAAASSAEEAQSAAAEINDEPRYVEAADEAQQWYLANCERPDLDG